MSEEILIGGISSANLVKGILKGYAIYVTSHRLIGVKKRKLGLASALATGAIGGAIGAVVGSIVADKLSKEERDKAIQEIVSNSDFIIPKEQVIHMELKKPGLLTGGHLVIKTLDGKKVKIKVQGKKEFNVLRELLSKFKPEVLKIK